MPLPSREQAPRENRPDIRTVPDLTPAERARQEADAALVRDRIQALRGKTREFDAEALTRVRAEVERAKGKAVKDEATLAIEEAIDAINTPSVTNVQRELNAAKWEGDPNATQPMMKAVESNLSELDRALGEAKGMEERLKSAGIDPDALAAGKVGLWKRLTHSQLIHDWVEANKAVAELAPKGGVDRRAEQSAGRRGRMAPPRAPRSPLGLG
ncbi:MAG: hypothetical protein HY437_01845 [Candidatus Magasanikbacteria bacterium]|nr:hypothetical protein [Candidatus Magasanikbacteria bacterium]